MAPRMPGRLVLVGSSIIEQWTDAGRQLAPTPALNLGVSGTTTRDWLPQGHPHHGGGLLQRRLLPQLQASDAIIFYTGSNDVNHRFPPKTTVSNTKVLLDLVWSTHPACTVFYLSVMACPQKARDGLMPAVDEINAAIQLWSKAEPRLRYVQVNPALKKSGMFVQDGLHLTAAAYNEVALMVRGALVAWLEAET